MTNVPESMFEPGSTPYGPPASQAATPPSAPAAPAAYVASPAAWPRAVAPPKPLKNGLGVASVWVGAFALLISFSGLYTSFIFILMAAIFGIIGMRMVGRPRTAAVVGLVLTATALTIAIGVTAARY